ncbi:MAG: substrate-binding domain-containing protein [Planctomycetes bacterium]|nr:substrate-binding domain-containing protein [Planctomycetota bacterium]
MIKHLITYLTCVASLAVFVSLPAAQEPKRKFLVGFSQCNNSEPWRQAMNAAAKTEAAKHKDIELVFSDAAQDSAKQVADVENFLTQKIDLLIISPNEAKPLTKVVKKVFDAGIPVVVLDRSIEGESYTCFIGADNTEIGKAAGEWIAKTLNGKGKIVELKGLMGSTPTHHRSKGFRDAIAKFKDIEIVHEAEAKWLRDEARTQFEHALAANNKIDLVYAHNDPMAIGAYLAAKAAGREKEMLFVGIDALPGKDGGAQAVIDGKLAVTFLYPNCGKEAVETALKILNKEKFERKIQLQTATVTKENAADFANPEKKK